MMKIVNPNAGGIDIGAEELYVAVPAGRDEQEIRRFETYTEDLHTLAKWLVKCGVDTVAMESTGVYWIPVYAVLKEYGIDVQLVNARHVKNVPGRKSDVKDCAWLRDLHSVGLLRGSFLPEETTAIMRSYVRQREALIEHRGSHVNRMQKALVQMNVRLDEVLSDVVGMTGLVIMRAIANGEQRPEELLKHRNRRCKAGPEQFVKALTAHYRAEHVFTLKQSLTLYDVYTEQIALCDAQVSAHLETIKRSDDDQGNQALPESSKSNKSNTHSKNAPPQAMRAQLFKITGGVDLTEVNGIHLSTAQTVISEIGTDMSKWPTAKHFASWLGLAPKNDITGGKIKKSRTLPGNKRAAQALRMAAQSLLKANNALGAYGRRIRAKSGAAQACVALAHKLARIIYILLRDKKPFQPTSVEDYDNANREREKKAIERRAAKLGCKLVPV